MARKPQSTPTADTYSVLQDAYNHFNKHLFGSTLPQCLITLSAEMRKAYGYYRHHPFKGTKKKDQIIDEIALNPFTFTGRTDREIYSTLVHEMVHLWQHHFGELKTKTAHDREWAAKMEEIGLMPSSTGAPGGKRTGRRVSHYIIEGGRFDLAEVEFMGVIEWRGAPLECKKRGSKRTKYTCPTCNLNAYGKPDIHLICGDCNETMEA
ncbi:MAG: sprT domain-containing protein [Gammaproteobacteria bacterium]|nr:MAG: sprT domain-containing protein [Gammaproteobacteria bacterium]